MVERGGLENRCALAGTVGSNPTPTAILLRAFRASQDMHYLRTQNRMPFEASAKKGSKKQENLLHLHHIVMGFPASLWMHEDGHKVEYNSDGL